LRLAVVKERGEKKETERLTIGLYTGELKEKEKEGYRLGL